MRPILVLVSFSSIWKQMRGNSVVASAEEEMSRAKRGEDLNSVQTLSDRHKSVRVPGTES